MFYMCLCCSRCFEETRFTLHNLKFRINQNLLSITKLTETAVYEISIYNESILRHLDMIISGHHRLTPQSAFPHSECYVYTQNNNYEEENLSLVKDMTSSQLTWVTQCRPIFCNAGSMLACQKILKTITKTVLTY